MALWRRHRFSSLEEQDGKDKIEAGSQFIVKRVGSTCVNDLDMKSSEQNLIEFYKGLLDLFHFEHGCKLRLIVDLSGAVLCSKDGALLQKFELANIRDVIYSTKKEEYCRYFILVAREESELTVKAHVLFCEDKQKAKLLYDTFIEVFTLGAEMSKHRRQAMSDSSALKETVKRKLRTKSESANNSDDNAAAVYSRANTETLGHSDMPRRQTWGSSSMTRPRQRTENELNDSFTEFALSRTNTTSSQKSHSIDIGGNKVLRQYSDVFM